MRKLGHQGVYILDDVFVKAITVIMIEAIHSFCYTTVSWNPVMLPATFKPHETTFLNQSISCFTPKLLSFWHKTTRRIRDICLYKSQFIWMCFIGKKRPEIDRHSPLLAIHVCAHSLLLIARLATEMAAEDYVHVCHLTNAKVWRSLRTHNIPITWLLYDQLVLPLDASIFMIYCHCIDCWVSSMASGWWLMPDARWLSIIFIIGIIVKYGDSLTSWPNT